jgi:hypothetical protein
VERLTAEDVGSPAREVIDHGRLRGPSAANVTVKLELRCDLTALIC